MGLDNIPLAHRRRRGRGVSMDIPGGCRSHGPCYAWDAADRAVSTRLGEFDHGGGSRGGALERC